MAAPVSELAVTALATLLGSGVVAAVVAGMFGRRKMSAEAAEIIQRTAGAEISRLDRRNNELEEEVADLRRQVEQLVVREGRHRDMLQFHVAWDARMQAILRGLLPQHELDSEGVFPAPPLYPPT